MSTSIDERVVAMRFDNKEFGTGVSKTLGDLDRLKTGLKLDGATKGLDGIAAAGKNVQLSHISSAVDAISNRFHALSIIGITALTNIANKAVNAGEMLIKSLTIDPIKTGLAEYETNLNAIQTILANTAHEGTKLSNVTAALNELNEYSDKTIYNFSEMARNIGTFTAAGVKLQVATEAIKGIANLAAISGSNAEQASTAMYQLSQALAAGRLTLMDWNSVVNAGMGGKVFQDAIMETARVHGVAIDTMVKDAGSFRNTLEKGWLTSDILTETLSKFTGDLTASQLKTMGYNEQQIEGILKMGKTAQDAATKVKTMSQLINTLQESATSGWAQSWQMIFGDFEEARTMFTDVNNVLGGFISASAEARNKVLGDWKELGGRTVIIEAISNAFNALIAVIKPIKDAFREIFPATTGKQLYDMSVAIRDFTANLKIGGTTANNIKRSFAGVFAVLSIGWEVVKQVAKTLLDLFGVVGDGSGGFLEVTANIGDFLVGLRNAIVEGNGLTRFFEKLGQILAIPIGLIKKFGEIIASVFKNIDGQEAMKSIDGVVSKLEPVGNIGNFIIKVWDKLGSILKNVWNMFKPIAANMSTFFSDLGSSISSALGGIDFGDVLGSINTGLFATLTIALRNFLGGGGGGFIDNVNDSISQLTDTLGALQNTLRATTLLLIAAAIGVLALSVSTLSKIDAAGLTRALTAITVMFTQLFASMAIFEKVVDLDEMGKMALLTGAMILLAIAIDILASAVKKLAELDWQGLAKGLLGVTTLLAGLVAAVKYMPDDKKLISTSLGLIVLAVAVKLLAGAVTDLSGLSWEEMAKGLTGVGALLGSLVLFTKFMEADKGGLAQGLGLVLLAAGVKILASALTDMAALSWEEIGRGLSAMAGGLTLIGAALYLIPPTSLLTAAGILVVAMSLGMIGDAIKTMGTMSWAEIGRGLTVMAGALTLIGAALYLIPPTALLSAAGVLVVAMSLGMIATALKDMATMSWEEIGKSLVLLAGSLGIIAGALMLMTGALAGAAALLVVVAALTLLAPVLQMFGQMSWEEMGKGLLMLAGVFVVIGAAGLLLTPVIPTLLALGVAVALIGVGMLAAGAGVLAFSIGLTALSVAGAAGAAAIVGIVAALIGLIPLVMQQIGIGLILFAQVIATAGPAITTALTTVLNAFLDAIANVTPKAIALLMQLLFLLLDALTIAVPKMYRAGLKIITGVLEGIRDNIEKIVTVALEIISKFIDGISNGLPKIINSGVNLIINFINGLANAIRNNSSRMGEAGANLATAIIEGMIRGLAAGAGRIADKARDIAKNALNAAKNALGISSPSKEFFALGRYSDEGLANGLTRYSSFVTASAEDLGLMAIDSLRDSLSNMSTIVSEDMDLTPTVTPVLDLSGVKKSSGQIAAILDSMAPISIETTRTTAKQASTSYKDNQMSTDGANSSSSGGDQYNFTQNITSPKAVAPAEIYRQTKNQLSVARGVKR